ncbi:hypothetical protein [Absidia glauca]|uniref:Velvet domain-containing protein n=1 Tax=Absidia glauca TaxID=4829 RepID=A0A163JBB1_ABSGL|nr:hypothetical protein [Absidia glauca]
MDSNVPRPTLPRYEYSHPTASITNPLPPVGHGNYHPSGDASVPTSSLYAPASSSLSTTAADQLVHPSNPTSSTAYSTNEHDQLKMGSTSASVNATSIDRIGYDEREMSQATKSRTCGRTVSRLTLIRQLPSPERKEDPDHPFYLRHCPLRTLQIPFFVLHVTLWSADRTEERNIISNPPKCTRVLMGSLVSSPSLLKNPNGEQGLYFAFPDLSIRTEGRYTLRFSLMKLVSADFQTDAKSKIIAQVFSDAFTVYSAKKFPGMTESTDLSKAFAKQGLKIPIRNDGK